MHFTLDTYLAVTGIVIGLLALGTAMPPFIQMIWGSPALNFEFFGGRHDKHPETLACLIKSRPIESRFLRFLGVTRKIAAISVVFEIHEHGSGKLMADRTIAPLHGPDVQSKRLRHLRPGEASVFFVATYFGGNVKVIRREGLETEISLPYGRYVASIMITEERTNKSTELQKGFIVGEVDKEFRWL